MAAMEANVPDILKAAELAVFEPVVIVNDEKDQSTPVIQIDDNELHRLKMGLTLQTMGRL